MFAVDWRNGSGINFSVGCPVELVKIMARFRIAQADDLSFLKDMLFEAVFWNQPDNRPSRNVFFENPEWLKAFHNWGQRTGDFALVAEDTSGISMGAAWYRFWTKFNHSYGFIDEHTPELGIAVLPNFRAQGIGKQLLSRTIEHCRQIGLSQISLSVEPHNFARLLYEHFGFVKVGESGTSWTMLLKF